MTPEILLKVQNLSVSYTSDGKIAKAVDRVSFSLNHGEVLCIVGESGCGKSTVAMAVPRLLPEPPAVVTAESVKLCETELANLPRERLQPLRGSRIGVIFQDPMTALSPLHRIGDQLAEAILLHQREITKKKLRPCILDWLNRVGIVDPSRTFSAYPHELSGGMQQRIMIAMALVHEPDLVIADEPTTALDVTTQAQVLNLMKKLLREKEGKKSGLLLITHDMGVVRSIATHVAVMYAGQIVESAPCEKLFSAPEHPYTQALLASMPGLSTRGRRLPVIEGFVPSPAEYDMLPPCRFHPRCSRRSQCPGIPPCPHCVASTKN